MKILHVLDHSIPLHSGYSFRTRAILEEQRRIGWETYHVTGAKQGTGDATEEIVDGLRFHRTAPYGGPLAGVPVLGQFTVARGLASRLAEIVPGIRPDVLHAHSPSLDGMAALSARKKFGIPVVYEVRAFWEDAAVDHGTTVEGSPRYRATRWLESRVLRDADHVTTICEGLRTEIVGRGVAADRVTVIPNAVDLGRFGTPPDRDEDLAAELGLGGGPVLGFIGSFYSYEGLDLLLDATARLKPDHPDLRVVLVGGGFEERRLRARSRELDLDGQVRFTGRVPHEEVPRYYSVMEIMAYPRQSLRLTELVTPLKPLEAMAQHKLVVASDVGGHRELIRDGETGILFEAGSAEALANAIARLLESRDRWPAMRSRGHEYVRSERNWKVSVERYRAVYGALGNGAP